MLARIDEIHAKFPNGFGTTAVSEEMAASLRKNKRSGSVMGNMLDLSGSELADFAYAEVRKMIKLRWRMVRRAPSPTRPAAMRVDYHPLVEHHPHHQHLIISSCTGKRGESALVTRSPTRACHVGALLHCP